MGILLFWFVSMFNPANFSEIMQEVIPGQVWPADLTASLHALVLQKCFPGAYYARSIPMAASSETVVQLNDGICLTGISYFKLCVFFNRYYLFFLLSVFICLFRL